MPGMDYFVDATDRCYRVRCGHPGCQTTSAGQLGFHDPNSIRKHYGRVHNVWRDTKKRCPRGWCMFQADQQAALNGHWDEANRNQGRCPTSQRWSMCPAPNTQLYEDTFVDSREPNVLSPALVCWLPQCQHVGLARNATGRKDCGKAGTSSAASPQPPQLPRGGHIGVATAPVAAVGAGMPQQEHANQWQPSSAPSAQHPPQDGHAGFLAAPGVAAANVGMSQPVNPTQEFMQQAPQGQAVPPGWATETVSPAGIRFVPRDTVEWWSEDGQTWGWARVRWLLQPMQRVLSHEFITAEWAQYLLDTGMVHGYNDMRHALQQGPMAAPPLPAVDGQAAHGVPMDVDCTGMVQRVDSAMQKMDAAGAGILQEVNGNEQLAQQDPQAQEAWPAPNDQDPQGGTMPDDGFGSGDFDWDFDPNFRVDFNNLDIDFDTNLNMSMNMQQ